MVLSVYRYGALTSYSNHLVLVYSCLLTLTSKTKDVWGWPRYSRQYSHLIDHLHHLHTPKNGYSCVLNMNLPSIHLHLSMSAILIRMRNPLYCNSLVS